MIERKEKIINMLENKTEVDNESIYDLLYSLYLHMALQKSTEDLLNGRVMLFEDWVKEMDAKYANIYK